MVLGIPYPPGAITPVDDPKVPLENKAREFIDWAATYWNPLQTPESITTEALIHRYDMHSATGEKRYLPTSLRLSKSEMGTLTSPEILPRVGVAMAFNAEVYGESLRRALFDTKGHWSHLRIVALWPDMTIWPCSLSGKVMSDMLESPRSLGITGRSVEMVRINGVNHFVSKSILCSAAYVSSSFCFLVSLRGAG